MSAKYTAVSCDKDPQTTFCMPFKLSHGTHSKIGIIDCTKVVKLGLLLSIVRVPGKMLDADTTNGNKTKITIQV